MADRSRAVLITGCSTGIGRATALRLAENGHRVYATARRLDTIEDLESKGCMVLSLDVTSEESMVAAVRAVESREGSVGALVNNAGYSLNGAIETVSMEDVRRQFETNVFGAIRMAQLVLPGMRRQKYGRIVNIGSMGGRLTFPGGGIYHGTKYALEGISDVLRFETRGFGVRVSLIEPGLVKTAFEETSAASMRPDAEDSPYREFHTGVIQNTVSAYQGPGGYSRLARGPESVAEVIEKAITSRRPKSRYITGPSGRGFIWTRRLLGDRGWDMLLRRNYPTPK